MKAASGHVVVVMCLMMMIILLGEVRGVRLAEEGVAATHQGCPTTFFAALIQLHPCRPAVAPFSPFPPNLLCCNAVRTLGQACLCLLINGPPISGVDRNMAMQLPGKCTVNFEPCDGRT